MRLYCLYPQERCNRCGELTSVRTMSFFTDETICMPCLAHEGHLKTRLRDAGIDLTLLEGCGTVPRFAGPTRPLPPLGLTQPAPYDADDSPASARGVSVDDLRAALRRLRAGSALLRAAPAVPPPGRDLPPTN